MHIINSQFCYNIFSVRTFLGGEKTKSLSGIELMPSGEQLNGRFGNLISKDNKAQHF
jgi:hypothetical protein